MNAPAQADAFDYARTARRQGWDSLPATVRSAVEAELGGAAREITLAGGGFTHGFAAVVQSSEARLFVKAAPASDPFIHSAYVREQTVLELLPPNLPIPQLFRAASVGSDDGTWQVLCFEAIDGYMPGSPWDPADLASVHRSLITVQEALAKLPRHLTGGPMSAGLSDDPQVNSVFGRLAAADTLPAFLPPGIGPRLGELQVLCDASAVALQGDAILHNDLRADNLILRHSDRSALICDWNFLAHGPGWADWVGLLLYARHGGIDPRPWLAESPLSADADPNDVDSWLAILAAYMTHYGMQPDIPTSPLLRAHGRFTARITLDWLIERRWS